MTRKSSLTLAAMLGVALGVAGLSIAADESPLEKQMSAIQAKTNAIRKATRTLPAWKLAQKNVAKDADEISKLAKEARKDKGPAEAQKKSFDDWGKLMDDMIKSSDDLAALARKPETAQPDAKKAFDSLNKSCSACHSVFRVEKDN